jgi:hypothetical protein
MVERMESKLPWYPYDKFEINDAWVEEGPIVLEGRIKSVVIQVCLKLSWLRHRWEDNHLPAVVLASGVLSVNGWFQDTHDAVSVPSGVTAVLTMDYESGPRHIMCDQA